MTKNFQLETKLVIAKQTILALLKQLRGIESDTKTPAETKLLQIKKIKEELETIGTEVDNIKNEITLITDYRVN